MASVGKVSSVPSSVTEISVVEGDDAVDFSTAGVKTKVVGGRVEERSFIANSVDDKSSGGLESETVVSILGGEVVFDSEVAFTIVVTSGWSELFVSGNFVDFSASSTVCVVPILASDFACLSSEIVPVVADSGGSVGLSVSDLNVVAGIVLTGFVGSDSGFLSAVEGLSVEAGVSSVDVGLVVGANGVDSSLVSFSVLTILVAGVVTDDEGIGVDLSWPDVALSDGVLAGREVGCDFGSAVDIIEAVVGFSDVSNVV